MSSKFKSVWIAYLKCNLNKIDIVGPCITDTSCCLVNNNVDNHAEKEDVELISATAPQDEATLFAVAHYLFVEGDAASDENARVEQTDELLV